MTSPEVRNDECRYLEWPVDLKIVADGGVDAT